MSAYEPLQLEFLQLTHEFLWQASTPRANQVAGRRSHRQKVAGTLLVAPVQRAISWQKCKLRQIETV